MSAAGVQDQWHNRTVWNEQRVQEGVGVLRDLQLMFGDQMRELKAKEVTIKKLREELKTATTERKAAKRKEANAEEKWRKKGRVQKSS